MVDSHGGRPLQRAQEMENIYMAEELTNRMGKCTPELEVKLKLGLHDGTANQNQSLLSV